MIMTDYTGVLHVRLVSKWSMLNKYVVLEILKHLTLQQCLVDPKTAATASCVFNQSNNKRAATVAIGQFYCAGVSRSMQEIELSGSVWTDEIGIIVYVMQTESVH